MVFRFIYLNILSSNKNMQIVNCSSSFARFKTEELQLCSLKRKNYKFQLDNITHI